MRKTEADEAAKAPASFPTPHPGARLTPPANLPAAGGSYVVDPVTGKVERIQPTPHAAQGE